MATSSFKHNIVIDTPEAAQRLVETLEQAEKIALEPNIYDNCPTYETITGDKIKDFFKE